MSPNKFTSVQVIKACAGLGAHEDGRLVHEHLIQSDCKSYVFIGSSLVGMYAKCGNIDDSWKHGLQQNVQVVNALLNMYVNSGTMAVARQVFDTLLSKDVICWTTMIMGYTKHGESEEAFRMFHQMQEEGLDPRMGTVLVTMYGKCGSINDARQLFDKLLVRDVFTWTSMIGGYVEHGLVEEAFHVFHRMQQEDVHVGTALVSMYARCRSIQDAIQVFDKLRRRNVVSWNAMIAAYAEHQQGGEAFKVFLRMQQEGSALISMYVRFGSINDARHVFDKLQIRNVITWTAMIRGYAEHGTCEEAFQMYWQMQQEGVKPNEITLISILNACASPADLELGKQLHVHIRNAGYDSDIRLRNALITMNSLIDMYAKCGSLACARQVFDETAERDVVSWNVMIAGLAQHGCGKDALELFEQMKQEGFMPNSVTFVGLLSACSHAGLVDEGCEFFLSMCGDYSLAPAAWHYGCMVDLLGRAGQLDDAEELINKMSFDADSSIWNTVLSTCRIHDNVQLAELAANCALKLEGQNASVYVLLSHIYAATGMWDNVAKLRKLMKDRGVKKELGCSWIEVKSKVHAFVADDRTHAETEEIYAELDELTRQIKEAEYVPDTHNVMHDFEEQQKE
ncbi:unnamed protein product [Sphagnum troendelagicum]|uniref:Pentatricopeptide repeat-containing protein n=1 Tax=Sphagnum troendelagicum TaxID=128251 RepID=A0ABP0UKY9_9BRYO